MGVLGRLAKTIALAEGLKLAEMVRSEAVSTASSRLERRSGQYQRSWKTTPSRSVIKVGNTAPHAAMIEFGTRAHRIKGNPFLKFNVGGTTIYTREVSHPGTKPYNILRDATEKAIRKYN